MRFGRGLAGAGRGLRPAVRPLAIGLGVTAGALALGYAANRGFEGYGKAVNPPAQVISVDKDGDGRQDGLVIFDTRTGGSQSYGQAPLHTGEPERSNERETKTALWVAGAVAVAVGAVIVLKGGK
jgi:hypothetical protein